MLGPWKQQQIAGKKKNKTPQALMLVYVLYPAVLRCHGNFLPICGEMEYIIQLLFILEGKHFCWGSMSFPC